MTAKNICNNNPLRWSQECIVVIVIAIIVHTKFSFFSSLGFKHLRVKVNGYDKNVHFRY